MSPRLVFPKKGTVCRVSEQEAKVLCCNVLNGSDYYFSVETPTQQLYKQKGNSPTRARSDISLYAWTGSDFSKLANMEFKAHTPGVAEFSKDVEKLVRERITGNWFHTLVNVRSSTLPDVFARLRGSFLNYSQEFSEIPIISIVFCICVVKKGMAYTRHFCYERARRSYEEYVRGFFDAPGPGEEGGWQILRRPVPPCPAGDTEDTIRQPESWEGEPNEHSRLRWSRAQLQSNRFDLQLKNPEALDTEHIRTLLQAVETADGKNPGGFNDDAAKEFRGWLDTRDRPLLEQAYALLSNWFLTDRECCRDSERGHAAMQMWDALFCARPEKRLTDPRRNYKILPEEFALWWPRQQACQRDR